jgi:superkiller protein 3
MLYADAPEATPEGAILEEIEIPRGVGGFFERRRKEGHQAHLEKQLRSLVDPRIEALEKRLEQEPDSFEAHRALGLLSILENNWERANAHLAHAHQLNPNDCQTHINYAIALAQRGQLQPAIDLLDKARRQWAASPFVLFNQATIALQARRYNLVLGAVAHLEKMWQQNPSIAQSYHDEAMTLRGLAYHYLGQQDEALAALEAAASHTVAQVTQSLNEPPRTEEPSAAPDPSPEDVEFLHNEPGNAENGTGPAGAHAGGVQLEGKMAEADTLCNLAIVEVEMGQINRAVQRLGAALRIQPGHTRVLNNLGVLAYEQGRYSPAVHYLSMAWQIEEYLHGYEPAIANHLGVALSSQGRLEEGLEHLQQAGSHERAEFEMYYNLGRAYVERGMPDRGVEYLKQAFQLNPQHPDVHIVLAAAYLLRGRQQFYGEARKHLLRALQINHSHRIAYADLVLLLMELDDGDDALKIVRQALKINPNSAEAMFLLGLITMFGGHQQAWAQAGSFFENALRIRPDLAASLFNIALCQFLLGFRDHAAKILERVTAHDPSISPAYYLIGMGHAEAGRYQEALWAWNTALHYEQTNPELHANIGFVHYQRGDFATASKSYLKAHQLAPGDAQILGALGLSFARAEKIPQAIDAFQRSLAIAPNNPITHSNLGLALYLCKKVELAMEEWRLVSQLDKGYAERRQEEQQKSYDDSLVAMRPLNWRDRIIRLSPALPMPHTRLLPGYNARAFRPAISDAALLEIQKVKLELDRTNRSLAWMNIKQ